MTEPEHPIYIDQFWQGSHHYFDESNVDYFERRPDEGDNVWLEMDQIPAIPPAQSAYPGTASLETAGVSGLALTNGVGDGKTFTSAIPGALLNLIPANYNDGVYQFRLFDANGTEVPYNPDVWVADGIREAIYFKEGVPSGFAAPFTFDYWQYTGDTAGSSITGGINLGGGAEVFKDVLGPDMRFRTLIGGGNITVSETGFDTIRIQDNGGSNINDLELYVAQNGNDANDGSLASPFLTLGRAFDEVEAKGWNDTAEIRILNTGGPLVMPPVLNLSTGTRGKQRQPLIIRGWGTGIGGATTPGVDLVKSGAVDAVLVDTDGSQILTITSAGTFVASDTGYRIRFTSGPMTTYTPGISGFTFSEVTTVVETFAKFVDADNVQITYADTTLPIVGDSFDVLQNNTTISLAGDTAWTTDGSTIVLEDLNIEASYVGNNSRFNILGNSEIRFRGVVISDTGAVLNTTVFELNNFDGTTLIGGIEAIDEDATAPGVVPNTKSIAFIGSASSTFRLGTNLEPSVRGKTAYSNLLATSLVPSLITLSAATYLGQSIAGFLTSDVYAGSTIDRTIGSLIGLVRRLEGGPGTLGSVSSSSVVNISNIHMVSAIGGLSIAGPVKAYVSGKCLIDGTGPLAAGEGVIDVINGAELVVDATLFEVAVSNADEIKYRISDSTLKILNVGAATDVFSSGGTVFDATDSELVFGPDVFSGAIVEAGINAGNTCFNLKNSQANLSPAVATLNTSGTVGIAMTSSTFDAAGYSLNLGQVGDGHTQALTMDMGSTLNAENITVTDMSGDVVVSRSTLNVAIALSFIAPNTSSSTNQMSVRWSSKVSVDTFSSTTAPVNVLGITDGSSFNVLQTMTINGVAANITGEAVFCERKSKLTVGGNFSFTQSANANVVRVSDGSEMDVGDDFTANAIIEGIPLLVETGSRAVVGGNMDISGIIFGAYSLRAISGSNVTVVGTSIVRGGTSTTAVVSAESDSHINFDASATVIGNLSAIARGIRVHNGSSVTCAPTTTLESNAPFPIEVNGESWMDIHDANVIGFSGFTTTLSVTDNSKFTSNDLSVATETAQFAVYIAASSTAVVNSLSFTNVNPMTGFPVYIETKSSFTSKTSLTISTPHQSTGMTVQSGSNVVVNGVFTSSSSSGGTGLVLITNSTMHCGSMVVNDNQLGNIQVVYGSSLTTGGDVECSGLTNNSTIGLSVYGNSSATVSGQLISNNDNTLGSPTAVFVTNASVVFVEGALTVSGNGAALDVREESKLIVEDITTVSNSKTAAIRAFGGSELRFNSTVSVPWTAGDANPINVMRVIDSECLISGELAIAVASAADSLNCETSKLTVGLLTFTNIASGVIGGNPVTCAANSQFVCKDTLDLGTQYNGVGFDLSENSNANVTVSATISNSQLNYGLRVRTRSEFQCGTLVASDNQLENILIQWDSSLSTTTITASNSVTGSGVSVGANSMLTVAQSVVANGNAGSALALSDGSACNVGTTVTAAGNLNTLSLDNHSRLSVQGATTLSDDAGTTVQAAGGSQAGFFAGLFLTWAAAEANPVTAVSIIGSECQIGTTLNIEVASTGDAISCDNSKFTADAIAFLNVASGTIGGRPIFCTNNTQFLCQANLNAGAQFTGNGFELAKNSTATVNGTTTLSGSGAGYGLYVRDASKIQTGAATVSDNNLNNIQIQQDSGMSVVGGDLTASGSVTGAGVSLNTNSTLTAGLNVGSDNNAQNAFVLRNASLVEVQGGVTCSGNTDTLLITQSSKMTVGSATLRDDPATIISLTSASFLTVIALLSIPWAAAESNPIRTISVAEGSDFYATTIAIETGTSLGDSIVCSDSNFEVSNTITFSNSAAGSIVGNVINCSQNSHFTCAGALNVGGEYTVNGLRVDGSSDVHIGGVATFNFVGAVNPNTGRGVFVTGASNVSFGATLSVRNHDLWGVYVGTSSSVDVVGTIDVQGNGVGGALGSGGGVGVFDASKFTSGNAANAGVTNGPSLFYLDASEMTVGDITVTNVVSVVTAVAGSKIRCGEFTSTASTGSVVSLLQSVMSAGNVALTNATGGPLIEIISSSFKAFSYTGSDLIGTNVVTEVYSIMSDFVLGNFDGATVTLGTYVTDVSATSNLIYAEGSNLQMRGLTVTTGTITGIVFYAQYGTSIAINGNVNITSQHLSGLFLFSGSSAVCNNLTISNGSSGFTIAGGTLTAQNATITNHTGTSSIGSKGSATFNQLTMDDNGTSGPAIAQLTVQGTGLLSIDNTFTINNTSGNSNIGFLVDNYGILKGDVILINDCKRGSFVSRGSSLICTVMTLDNNATDLLNVSGQLNVSNDSTAFINGTLTINNTTNAYSLFLSLRSKLTTPAYINGGASSATITDVYLTDHSEFILPIAPLVLAGSMFTGTTSPPTYISINSKSIFMCDILTIANAGAAIAGPVIELFDDSYILIKRACDLGGNFTGDGIVSRGSTSSIRGITANGGATGIIVDTGMAQFYGNTVLNNLSVGGISARINSIVTFETDDIGPASFSSTTSRRPIECVRGSKMTFTSCNVTLTDGTDFGILVNEGSSLLMNGATSLNVGSTVGQTYQGCLFVLAGSWVDMNIFATLGGAIGNAIWLDSLARLTCFRLLQGTIANGGYGLRMNNGTSAHVAQKNLSTVTGALGDVFLGGQGVKTWANIAAGGVANRNDYSAAAPENVALS